MTSQDASSQKLQHEPMRHVEMDIRPPGVNPTLYLTQVYILVAEFPGHPKRGLTQITTEPKDHRKCIDIKLRVWRNHA